MRPITLLPHDLPDHLHLVEDPDILALVCTRCGDVAHFSAAGATADELHRTAADHRCPPAPRP